MTYLGNEHCTAEGRPNQKKTKGEKREYDEKTENEKADWYRKNN